MHAEKGERRDGVSDLMVEESVVGRAQSGDPEAFRLIFERFQAPIASFIYRLVEDRELARDLTQDTFLKAFAAIGRTEPGLNVGSWLFTIASNTAITALRRRKVISWLPLERIRSSAEGGDPADRYQHRETLEAALGCLPKDQLACLLLRAHYGFTYEEIGRIMGISMGAAKTRVSRARLALADRQSARVGEAGR